jgi:hypothetical protein
VYSILDDGVLEFAWYLFQLKINRKRYYEKHGKQDDKAWDALMVKFNYWRLGCFKVLPPPSSSCRLCCRLSARIPFNVLLSTSGRYSNAAPTHTCLSQTPNILEGTHLYPDNNLKSWGKEIESGEGPAKFHCAWRVRDTARCSNFTHIYIGPSVFERD